MKKSSKTKENTPLTFEEIKSNAWNSYMNIPQQKSFGEPTYEFKVGDKVRIGNLDNCVIEDVTSFKGDVVYGFTYSAKKKGLSAISYFSSDEREEPAMETHYMYTPWYKVRPLTIGEKETHFTKEDNIDIRFYNTSLESLLNKFYLSGVEMNPPYQRGYVWDDKDKESLLDSIFNHIEIGKFAFIHRDYSHEIGYEILDGKQRLSTLLDFYENRLPYKGVYYNDLSFKDRHTFLNTDVTIGETGNLEMEQIYKYFYTLNKAGKVMDEEHLNMIREQIVEELEQGDFERD